jgi:hypothetical protein
MTKDTEAPAAPAADAADPSEAMWQEALTERVKPAEDTPAAPVAADDETPPQAAPDGAGEPPADDGAADADIWATAPEPLRNAYKDLEKRFEKDHRQIAGQRRKIAELMRAEPAAKPPAKADFDDALTGLEDYPEIAGAVRKLTEPLYENIANAEAAREAAIAADLDEQADLLEDDHPGWLDTLKANWPAFQVFVTDENQPAWIAKAYAANEKQVTDAAQAARMIASFKATLGTPPAADPPATRTNDRRQRQLSGLSTPPPRGGSATTSLPATADPEAIWADALRKKRQA